MFETDGMVHETSEPEAIEFYTPAQLSDLLHTANEQTEHRHLLPVIALCGLAGRRRQEAVRLTWEDVFRVELPCRDIPDQEQDPRTTAREYLPRPGAAAPARFGPTAWKSSTRISAPGAIR